ncbi:MAG: 3-hydroxyisobutyrate dehydrogenase [Microbacteriaceae bacterium]|nr:3-hydroxyisobutyrate dehydrogenase [Microbacteriaceae bacterium]
MRVAVLGTGTMGAGIVRSLLREGIDVTAWNRHLEKAVPLEAAGARIAPSPTEAVRDADVVLTMLFDEAAVSEQAAEFLGAMPDGAVWMQSATVGPAGIRRLAELAAASRVAIVDAPVVGTKKPAETGTLTVVVSGEQPLIERLRPVLDAIGSKTVNVGVEIGAASGLKLACNAWVASITAGAAQSIAMCEALGVDPALFTQTIAGGASDTPYLQLKGAMMIAGDFTPAFGVDGLLKDVGLMIDAIRDTSASDRLLIPLRDALASTSNSGHDKDDISAVVTSFSRLAA